MASINSAFREWSLLDRIMLFNDSPESLRPSFNNCPHIDAAPARGFFCGGCIPVRSRLVYDHLSQHADAIEPFEFACTQLAREYIRLLPDWDSLFLLLEFFAFDTADHVRAFLAMALLTPVELGTVATGLSPMQSNAIERYCAIDPGDIGAGNGSALCDAIMYGVQRARAKLAHIRRHDAIISGMRGGMASGGSFYVTFNRHQAPPPPSPPPPPDAVLSLFEVHIFDDESGYDGEQCLICMERVARVEFNCGHTHLCLGCAHRICSDPSLKSICPFCREPIERTRVRLVTGAWSAWSDADCGESSASPINIV
jgi:hypothetical protein